MSTGFPVTGFGLFLAAGTIPFVAYSQVYLTEDQAAAAIFSGDKLVRKTIDLTPEEIKKIEAQSGENVKNKSVVVWVGEGKRALFVDQVLGKHEFITYAVGVTPDKKLKGIDILEYRETYGQGVKGDDWRNQFVGKDLSAPLKLNKDIVNISGATLSSAHVTAGVRRVLNTYDVIRERL